MSRNDEIQRRAQRAPFGGITIGAGGHGARPLRGQCRHVGILRQPAGAALEFNLAAQEHTAEKQAGDIDPHPSRFVADQGHRIVRLPVSGVSQVLAGMIGLDGLGHFDAQNGHEFEFVGHILQVHEVGNVEWKFLDENIAHGMTFLENVDVEK